MTSQRGRRVAIGVVAALAIAAFLFVALIWLVVPLGCEDADDRDFDTVLCDSERGAGWRALQIGLVGVFGLALVAAAIWSVRSARWLPLLIASAAAIPAFIAIFAIYDVELDDKPLPHVTSVRLLDDSCTFPCRDGIRVAVTVDRPAEVDVDIGPTVRYEDGDDRQFNPPTTSEVDAGTHELRAKGEILNPPDKAGPLPPGDYVIDVVARPQDAGNQQPQATEPVLRRVTILP